MSSTVMALAQMADHAATQNTASHESWTDFLKTAAWALQISVSRATHDLRPTPRRDGLRRYKLWNEKMRGYLGAEETKLLALTDSALGKLRNMSDEEYAVLDLSPYFNE